MSSEEHKTFIGYAQLTVHVVIAAALVWVGSTTIETKTSVAELKVRMEERSAQYSHDISEMKAQVNVLQTQVTAAALAAATAATAAAIAALPKTAQDSIRKPLPQ